MTKPKELPLWLVMIHYRSADGEEHSVEFEEVEAATDLAAIEEGERRVQAEQPQPVTILNGQAVEIE